MITVRRHRNNGFGIESLEYAPYKAAMAKNNNNDTVELLDDEENPILANLNRFNGKADNNNDKQADEE